MSVSTSKVGGPSGGRNAGTAPQFLRAQNQAQQLARQAEARLSEYRNMANSAARSAESALSSVERFRFANVRLGLTGPAHISPNYYTIGISSSGITGNVQGVGAAAQLGPSNITAFSGSTVAPAAPPIEEVNISPMPALLATPTIPAFTPPATTNVSLPTTQITVPGEPGIPDAPTLDFGQISLSAPLLPESLQTPEARMEELNNLVGRLGLVLRGAAETPLDLSRLTSLGDIIQGMVNGQQKAWMRDTATASQDSFSGVPDIWSRRGMRAASHEAFAQQYASARREQEQRYREVSDNAAFSVAAYKEATDGIRMVPVVYAAVEDLKLLKLDIDVRREVARIGSSVLNLISAAAEAEAYALQMKIRAAQARALGSAARAKAQGYRDTAQVAEAQVDMNQAIVRSYSAVQQAKRLRAQAYRAQVRAERAKMDAFLGQSSADYDIAAVQAEQISAHIRGQVAVFLAQVAELEGNYRSEAAEASAVSARNRAVASAVASRSEINNAVVAQNSALSAKASADISLIDARIREGSGAFLQNEVNNALAVNSARQNMLEYQVNVITQGLVQEADSGRLEGQEREFRSAARHFVSLSESAIQTARMCQQINANAGEAEAQLRISVGQARAAIESGRLAGFRASNNIEADYRSSASERGSFDTSRNYSETATQSDIKVIEKDAI